MDKAAGQPAERLIGQLIADTIRLYGANFWRSLPLGIPLAGTLVGLAAVSDVAVGSVILVGGSVLMALSYVASVVIAYPRRIDHGRFLGALALATFVFIPMLFLAPLFVLPGVAWFALFGLSVQAVLIERLPLVDSLRRALALARADFVHALGAVAALVVVVFVTATAMFLAVRAGSGEAAAVAAFLTLLVTSPILFLGSALLYADQAARAEVKSRTKRPKEA